MSRNDDKNLKKLRELALLPENKQCADCSSKGPTYINITFNTFICTTCSGIHREFNHRVKSIGMSRFSSDEMKKILQTGGNKVDSEIYLKNWDPNREKRPDANRVVAIRQWIRHKYFDLRWADQDRVDSAIGKKHSISSPSSSSSSSSSTSRSAEPLSNILGGDIPPIILDENKPSGNDAVFGDFTSSSSPSSSSSSQNVTGGSFAVLDDPLLPNDQVRPPDHSPPSDDQNGPSETKPRSESKSDSLKNQLDELYGMSMIGQTQQPAVMNQPQMQQTPYQQSTGMQNMQQPMMQQRQPMVFPNQQMMMQPQRSNMMPMMQPSMMQQQPMVQMSMQGQPMMQQGQQPMMQQGQQPMMQQGQQNMMQQGQQPMMQQRQQSMMQQGGQQPMMQPMMMQQPMFQQTGMQQSPQQQQQMMMVPPQQQRMMQQQSMIPQGQPLQQQQQPPMSTQTQQPPPRKTSKPDPFSSLMNLESFGSSKKQPLRGTPMGSQPMGMPQQQQQQPIQPQTQQEQQSGEGFNPFF